MAKKNNAAKVQRYCGECAHGLWYYTHINLDLNGRPICCHCTATNTNRLRNERACRLFKPKTT